jgi:hypothetical protein
VIFRAHHLREEILFECYLAEHEGTPMVPPAAEHLADCPECAARYADLRQFMDRLQADADTELDELFPPDRLRAQQQQIARRLEHIGHAARIISFPGHPSSRHAAGPRPRVAPRWLAGAAAAGLAIGVSLGSALYRRAPETAPSAQPAGSIAASIGTTESAAQTSVPEPATDLDFFISELEVALERPYTPELVALDELTPHVREVRLSRVSR